MNKLMMFNWNVLRDEEPGPGGENGGGAGGADLNNLAKEMDGGEGGAGGAESKSKVEVEEGKEKPNGQGEEKPNDQGEGKPKGEGEEKPKGDGEEVKKPEPLSEEEIKSYKDALKLDEKIVGKGIAISEAYLEKLPAMFKASGISPEAAKKLAHDFAKIQQDVDREAIETMKKNAAWRNDEMRKMNEAFFEKYDKAERAAICRAAMHYFKKGTPMYDIVRESEIGVDPGILELLLVAGQRLPSSGAPGAASGAGTGEKKGLADSFMGS